MKLLHGNLIYLTRYACEIWNRLLSKTRLQYLNKWFISEHYSIQLSYELIEQTQDKDLHNDNFWLIK